MKVVLEISNKVLNLVSGIVMTQADTEEEEKQVEEIIERMKASEEPFFIDLEKIDDKEVKTQMPLALAMFAIGQEMRK
jgi:hypothetical protein